MSSGYPPPLAAIVEFFDGLGEDEKRENLIAYADAAENCGPKAGERFDLEDERKDEECTDTVVVFLRVDRPSRAAHFRIRLGPHVQTLTKAMAAILCKGLDGATPEEIMAVPQDFVPRIVRRRPGACAQPDRLLYSHAPEERLPSLAPARARGRMKL